MVEAYRRSSLAGDNTSLNLLYALFGALHDLPRHALPADLKQRLAAEANAPWQAKRDSSARLG